MKLFTVYACTQKDLPLSWQTASKQYELSVHIRDKCPSFISLNRKCRSIPCQIQRCYTVSLTMVLDFGTTFQKTLDWIPNYRPAEVNKRHIFSGQIFSIISVLSLLCKTICWQLKCVHRLTNHGHT